MLYNINKTKPGDKITRTIGTDLRFNVLPSALKRGAIEGNSGLFWFP